MAKHPFKFLQLLTIVSVFFSLLPLPVVQASLIAPASPPLESAPQPLQRSLPPATFRPALHEDRFGSAMSLEQQDQTSLQDTQNSPLALYPSLGNKYLLFYGPTAPLDLVPVPNRIVIWDDATWRTKTQSDFAVFDAIVFSDYNEFESDCSNFPPNPENNVWGAAIDTKTIWQSAITGNIILINGDPDTHRATRPGAAALVNQGIRYAAAGATAGPGLYLALGCTTATFTQSQAYEVLDGGPLENGPGDFEVIGLNVSPPGPTQGQKAHILRAALNHEVMQGLSNQALSNWRVSAHGGFT